MPDPKPKKIVWINKQNLLLAGLFLACAAALFWLASDLRYSFSSGEFSPRHVFNRPSGNQPPLTVEKIQPWMTFDYLNHVFNLPADYLKNQLHIQDPHYPNVSLTRYAKQQGTSVSELLKSVQQAIRSHGGK
jgi:hypothetical protein